MCSWRSGSNGDDGIGPEMVSYFIGWSRFLGSVVPGGLESLGYRRASQ